MTLLLAGGRRGGAKPPFMAGSAGAELGGTGNLEGVSRVDRETSPDNPSRRREVVPFVSGSKSPVTRVVEGHRERGGEGGIGERRRCGGIGFVKMRDWIHLVSA